jgi:hypothetical protein
LSYRDVKELLSEQALDISYETVRWLYQHVEDLTLVVDGTPQMHSLASDPHRHLVEVPAIARPWIAPA